MRTLVLAMLLTACGGESGFQNNPKDEPVIEGQATMEVEPTSLTWTDMELGIAKSQSVLVKNVGDNILKIESGRLVDDANNQFYTDEDANADVELNPGADREVIVVCNPMDDTATELTGTLRLKTNDADNPVLDIPLSATLADGGDTGDSG